MKANKFAKNDEGVSAVIGVILMVAITVILAAVIAAFVFGMVGGVSTKKNPAFTVKRVSGQLIDVSLQDLGGAKTINTPVLTTPASASLGTFNNLDASNNLQPGSTAQIDLGSDTQSVHVVISGNVDGNPQVVVDATV